MKLRITEDKNLKDISILLIHLSIPLEMEEDV